MFIFPWATFLRYITSPPAHPQGVASTKQRACLTLSYLRGRRWEVNINMMNWGHPHPKAEFHRPESWCHIITFTSMWSRFSRWCSDAWFFATIFREHKSGFCFYLPIAHRATHFMFCVLGSEVSLLAHHQSLRCARFGHNCALSCIIDFTHKLCAADDRSPSLLVSSLVTKYGVK